MLRWVQAKARIYIFGKLVMAWNWGVNLESAIKDKENPFFCLMRIIAINYYKYFTQMLFWSMTMAFILVAGQYVLEDILKLSVFRFTWIQFVISMGFVFMISKMYDKKPNWLFWLAAAAPYILIPSLLCAFLGFIGLIIAAFLVISTSFFLQDIITKDSNILDAYLNSISITWRYNLRLVVFILVPWLLLTSLKFTFLNMISIPNITLLLNVIYWVSTVLFLPWVVFTYSLFYEFLQIEKSNA